MNIEHLCVYLRPFNETSLRRKADNYVAERRRLNLASEVLMAQVLNRSLDAKEVAKSIASAAAAEGGIDQILRKLGAERYTDFVFHDALFAKALPKTVMTYCLSIPNDIDVYADPGARWLWDGSMWHHNVPELTDGQWERAPSHVLSEEALFDDLHAKDWRVLVKTIVDQATLVLMVPSARRGTRWELQYLKATHLLERTIFIKPAHFSDSDWVETRQALRDDLVVPEYRKGGYLFTAAQGRADTFQARWQEIAEYEEDFESVRDAMRALRPALMSALTRRPRDPDLPDPWLFRAIMQSRYAELESDERLDAD